ncbi:MAG: hypothetical protein COA78_03525 [Blastopirellula sp.]|nr:MAG: hypothetical protein COA78_03525 [Blastopirellula sp.]
MSLESTSWSDTHVNLFETLPNSNRDNLLTHVPLQKQSDKERAFQAFEKWSKINEGHHNEKRIGERYHYHGLPVVTFTTLGLVNDTKLEELVCIEVFAKDISTNGAAFLCSDELRPIGSFSSNINQLQLSKCISVKDQIALGLQIEPNQWTWLHANVVRIRKALAGFIDVGLEFTGRA